MSDPYQADPDPLEGAWWCTGCQRWVLDDVCDECQGRDELEACADTPEAAAESTRPAESIVRDLVEELDRPQLAKVAALLLEHLYGVTHLAGPRVSALVYREQLEAVADELGQERLDAADGYHYEAVRAMARELEPS